MTTISSCSVIPPTSQSLIYERLTTENGEKKLTALFLAKNPDNPNYTQQYTVQNYGKGDQGNEKSIKEKTEKWGPRADKEEIEKCWVVLNKDSEELGFVNIGLSTIEIADKTLYEIGILFKDLTSEEVQKEAFSATLIKYPEDNKSLLKSCALVGTLSTIEYVKNVATEIFCKENKITEEKEKEQVCKRLLAAQNAKESALVAAGLTKLTLESTDVFAKNLEESIKKDSSRFTIKDNQILEDERPVSVFYRHFTPCVKC